MKLNLILLTVILFPISIYIYLYYPANQTSNVIQKSEIKTQVKDINKSYSHLKDSIDSVRKNLAANYLSANTVQKKKEILQQAKVHLINSITHCLFPLWEGTKWEFYGTSQKPNEGSIACGYFVSTLLEHTGFKLDRVGLAEVASETMIRKIVSKEQIKVYRNIDFNKFLPALKNQGDGLYLVGLDFHTGFILCENQQVYFIHSSGIAPFCVVKEKAEESTLLIYSRYRVTGKISSDNVLLEKWILDKKF